MRKILRCHPPLLPAAPTSSESSEISEIDGAKRYKERIVINSDICDSKH